MKDYLNPKGLCIVCKETMTTTHVELENGVKIFVCDKCLETTKENFIWICINCKSIYIRPKSIVLKRLTDPRLREAYRMCEDMQIIQGIECCIECDPEKIMSIMAAAKSEKSGGHC